ncbi:uncharacterized protein LOC141648962 [Silene latifolia]|uniref:uncharacterized protein LOC141648962 n=1 Tax=Silene latifolia TaxID=37657 RepID=UPI003D779D58
MASSSSVSLPAIPNFAEESYDYWSVKMKLFLKSCDLWEIVEKGFEARVEGSEYSAAQLQQLKTDEMKDARALSYIHSVVLDSITPKIIRASSAKEAWNTLLEEFHGSEKVRILRLNKLRRDYANIKMRDDENIKEYSSRFMELVNRMQIYGESTSDDTIIPKVLVTLNTKFNTIASMIEEFKDLSTLGTTELFGSLLAHDEKFIKSDERPIEGAFQTKHKSKLPYLKEGNGKYLEGNNSSYAPGRFPLCGSCGKNNHSEQNYWFKGKPKLQM